MPLTRQLVDLVEGHVDGGIAHQRVVGAECAREVFDGPLRFGDGAFNGDDVLHGLGAAQKLLQPLQFGLRRHEAGLGVVVALGDVVGALVFVDEVAERAHLGAEVVELLGGDADGVLGVAVARGAVGNAALLKIAAHFLHQCGDVGIGLVEGEGLQVHVGGVDHLHIFQFFVVGGGGILLESAAFKFGLFLVVLHGRTACVEAHVHGGIVTGHHVHAGLSFRGRCTAPNQRQRHDKSKK